MKNLDPSLWLFRIEKVIVPYLFRWWSNCLSVTRRTRYALFLQVSMVEPRGSVINHPLRIGETIELKGPFMVLRLNSDEYWKAHVSVPAGLFRSVTVLGSQSCDLYRAYMEEMTSRALLVFDFGRFLTIHKMTLKFIRVCVESNLLIPVSDKNLVRHPI